MTKQEEIRGVIQRWAEYWSPNCPDGVLELLEQLHSQGLVIKGSKYVDGDNLYYVEPLIKEKK